MFPDINTNCCEAKGNQFDQYKKNISRQKDNPPTFKMKLQEVS